MSTSRLENNTQNLQEILNVIQSLPNNPSSSDKGTPPPAGCEFRDVKVTSNSIDVTQFVFVNGKIDLSKVRGEIKLELTCGTWLPTPEISIYTDVLATPEIEVIDDNPVSSWPEKD